MTHRWRSLFPKDLSRATAVVVGGVVLGFVPTLYTLFPALATNGARWPRQLVIGGWLLVAVLAVRSSLRRDLRLDRWMGHASRLVESQRKAAAMKAINLLMTCKPAELRAYKLQLFLWDRATKRLEAATTNEGYESEAWEAGKGATGYAFMLALQGEDQLVVARGTTVSDGSYGLDVEQQERYKKTKVVAAIPLRDDDRAPMGVLTAWAERADKGQFFSTPDGEAAMIEQASATARILIDIAGLRGTTNVDTPRA